MIKGGIICLVCVLLFLRGYSQSDSTARISGDSIPNDTASLISQHNPESNVARNGKYSVYTMKPVVDIPIIAVGSVFSVYASTKIYTKGPSTEEQINNLKISNIDIFDRWAVTPYSKSIDRASYYPFYAAIPLPFVMLLARSDTRHDFWELSVLYVEAMSITGLFGTGAPFLIDRYRPYTYSAATPMNVRLAQNAKNSAFSGHVEVMATSTFFIAKVYGDYNPDTKLLMYSLASVATAGLAYMRLEGGMHFPSDVTIGAAIGVLSGILVPQFHKHKIIRNTALSIIPYTNQEAKGLVLTYTLK